MAQKRYYLSDNDYDYFIRVFPKARSLAWFQTKESDTGICWYADIDFENIPESDKQLLGDEYEICLERLERSVRTEPPVLSDTGTPPKSPSFPKRRVKREKRRGIRFILSSALISLVIIAATASLISIPAESENVLKKRVGFMELLQKTAGVSQTGADKADIAALLNQCQAHFKAKRLTTGNKGTALNCYQQVLRLEPDNSEAKSGLKNIEDQYILWAKRAMRGGNPGKVRQYMVALGRVNPESPDLAALRQALGESEKPPKTPPDPSTPDTSLRTAMPTETKVADTEKNSIRNKEPGPQITKLLKQCRKHLKAGRLTIGKKGNALDCYQEVSIHDPDNAEVRAGLKKMEKQYVRWAKRALRGRNLKKVRQYLESLTKINPESSDLTRLKNQLAKLEKQRSAKVPEENHSLRAKSPEQSRKANRRHGRKTHWTTEELTQISLGTEEFAPQAGVRPSQLTTDN